MKTLPTYAATAWGWLGQKLMKHWMLVFAGVLVLLAMLVLLSGKKTQEAKETVQQAVQQSVLSTRQVRAKEKVIAALVDSATTKEVELKQVKHQRDSVAVVARVHEAKADSAIKALTHETLPDADATPSRVFDRLASYRPAKYALSDNDSIY